MWALFEKINNKWEFRGNQEHDEIVSEFLEEYEGYLVDRAATYDHRNLPPVNPTKAVYLDD